MKTNHIRIGLVGAPQAGKTSLILAALSAGRLLQRDDRARLSAPGTGSFIPAEVESFLNGQGPDQTPLESLDRKASIRLTEDARPGWECTIELVDAPGELFHRDLSSGNFVRGECPAWYRDHRFDALFVLAPQPSEDPSRPDSPSDVQARQEALEIASHIRKDLKPEGGGSLPIALLVTKRDRALARPTGAPSRRELERCDDLEHLSSAEWSRLTHTCRDLENSVGKNGFAAFGVSSHGPAPEDVGSAPKAEGGPHLIDDQLCAFGIRSALLWAAQRVEADREARAAAARRRRIRTAQRLALAGALVLIAGGAWSARAAHAEWSENAVALEDAAATPERLRDSANYFQGLLEGKRPANAVRLWPFYERSAAEELLEAAQDRLEALTWGRIDGSEAPATRIAIAEEYLSLFPNGRYSKEAQTALEDAEVALLRVDLEHRVEAALEEIERAGADPMGLATIGPQLRTLEFEVGAELPAGDDLLARLRSARERVSTTLARLDRDDALRKLKRRLDDDDFRGAVELAAEWETLSGKDDGELVVFAQQFRANLPKMLDHMVDHWIAGQHWQTADVALEDYQYWPQHWKTPNLTQQVAARALEVDEAHDRTMYEYIRERYLANRLDPTAAEGYLLNAPTGSMQMEVEAVRDYLLAQAMPRSGWRFEISSFRFQTGDGADDVRLEVVVDGAVAVSEWFEVDRGGDAPGKEFRGVIPGTHAPDDEIVWSIRATDYDWPDPSDDMGRFDGKLRLDETDHRRIRLDGTEDRAWLILRLIDPLPRPGLPEWQR